MAKKFNNLEDEKPGKGLAALVGSGSNKEGVKETKAFNIPKMPLYVHTFLKVKSAIEKVNMDDICLKAIIDYYEIVDKER